MKIEECIEQIANNGKLEDMESLSNILEDTMKHLKNCNEEMYKKYEMELYKLAYGNILTREMAEDIVSKMQPYGKKWTFEDIKDVQMKYGADNLRTTDLFIVMNSAFNDYRDLFQDDTENYLRFAVDFIEDEDAKEDKVFLYYTIIPR